MNREVFQRANGERKTAKHKRGSKQTEYQKAPKQRSRKKSKEILKKDLTKAKEHDIM